MTYLDLIIAKIYLTLGQICVKITELLIKLSRYLTNKANETIRPM